METLIKLPVDRFSKEGNYLGITKVIESIHLEPAC